MRGNHVVCICYAVRSSRKFGCNPPSLQSISKQNWISTAQIRLLGIKLFRRRSYVLKKNAHEYTKNLLAESKAKGPPYSVLEELAPRERKKKKKKTGRQRHQNASVKCCIVEGDG